MTLSDYIPSSPTEPPLSLKSRDVSKAQQRWKLLQSAIYAAKREDISSSIQTHFYCQMDKLEKILFPKESLTVSALDYYSLLAVLEELEASPIIEPSRKWNHLFKNAVWMLLLLASVFMLRALWLEHYYIPTGSMRPTYREGDHPLVLKSQFALNDPWRKSHLYFDPQGIPFGRTIVFSSQGLPYCDNQVKYLGLFSTYKKYVKRCMGRPGDQLFFYGGRLFQFNQRLRPAQDPYYSTSLEELEHIPYLEPYFHLVKEGEEWCFTYLGKKAMTFRESSPGSERLICVSTASDRLYGLLDYAQTKLLLPGQRSKASLIAHSPSDRGNDIVAYLEVLHIQNPKEHISYMVRSNGDIYVQLPLTTFNLPLRKEQIQLLWKGIYTSRFKVYKERAYGLATDPTLPSQDSVPLLKVPDGCYEFIGGKAYEIGWGGKISLLPDSHPLYEDHSLERLQWLFQYGMTIHPRYVASEENPHFPHRYLYWKNGELHLFNRPLGISRKNLSPTLNMGDFIDRGLPQDPREWLQLDDGYLALGDNHAQSADSRIFGLVPKENLQGTLLGMVWPVMLDDRYPTLHQRVASVQPDLPLTVVNLTVHLFLIGGVGTYLFFLAKRKKKVECFYRKEVARYAV